MPQENGEATGAEHCAEDGRLCPYCGSENTDSGTLDTQAGQVIESDCECLACGRRWGNLYNIAGYYDDAGDDTLHEDLEQHEKAEKADRLETERDFYRDTLIGLRKSIWAKDIPSPATPEYVEWHRNCTDWMELIDKALEGRV